jgi:predicted CopG family antitoxin
MKTITLDEEAYARLKSWKRESKDSFSSVVKKVVPVPGTLGAMLRHLDASGATDDEKDRILEETVRDRSLEKADPWI